MRPDSAHRVPPTRKARVALRMLLNLTATVILLLAAVRVFPQLGGIRESFDTLWVVILVAALNVLSGPLLMNGFVRLFPKVSPAFALIAFPFVSLILTAVLLDVAGWLSPGLVINGFRSAFFLALLMVAVSLTFAGLFSADDESLIYRWMLKRTSTRLQVKASSGKPGIVFLEIDGLGAKALKDAMTMGKTPNMKRWADRGSHKLIVWDSDLSSQTSAAQAGILHGHNTGIPAFRWYDKAKRNIVVSSSTRDLSQIEKDLSDGQGLLSSGGTARASLLSGDASRVLMTASRAFEVAADDMAAYYAYFFNPSNLLRSLSLMVWEWVLEKQAAWSQRLRNERPRVARGGIYFILRSLMTVLLRDFSLFALKGDMYSGVPFVYVTLAGYDEVSHHSGIRRPDTLEVLRKLDREFGKLEKVARHTARKYKFVVLSDHGHTQGTTFKDRYGESLVDVVRRAVKGEGKDYHVAGYGTKHESAYYLEAAFRDYQFSNSRLGKRINDRFGNNQQYVVGQDEENSIVVLASGNLGLISFTTAEHRLSLEEITEEFPGLLPGLVEHPGVGFVMVHSRETGAVALGKKGMMHLATGVTEGVDPLADYGPLARQNLVRTDGFANAPDILVMSTYWKDSDEVAAFEEQVASHGGAGGEQSRPFILYPGEFQLGTDKIVGAESVYRIFKRWTSEVQKA